MDEELEPTTKRPKLRYLEDMSIEALHDYIVELDAEIARVHEVIAVKEKAHGTAESVFRS